MRRLPRSPSLTPSSTVEAEKTSLAATSDLPGSARSPSHNRPVLPGMPPLPDRQHVLASLRAPTRTGEVPSARKGVGRRSTDPNLATTTPGRSMRAAPPLPSIDKLLDEWVQAEPGQATARQQAATLIQRCRSEKQPKLDLSGLELDTLPDCLDRLALRELNVTDCRLQVLPRLPPTLTALTVRQNNLTGLPPLPAGLVKLDATANQLPRLQSLPARLEYLALGGNQLTALREVPKRLTYLDLSSNSFKRLPDLPATLRYLNLSNNLPMDLHGLPATLAKLEISHMRLLSVPALPTGLTKLSARDNDLIELCDLPPGLTHLNVSGNRLHALPVLPATMSHLIARFNRIRQLPELPDSLVRLDVSHNALTSLPPSIDTARHLSHIDLSLNQISGPQLAAFVDRMKSLGKNMSCIQFDRVQQVPGQEEGASAAASVQGSALDPHAKEVDGRLSHDRLERQERPVSQRRSRAQRVTDTIPIEANRIDALRQADAPATIFAVPEGGSPRDVTDDSRANLFDDSRRSSLDGLATSNLLDDWHLVEGLSEWEHIHPDDLQRPESN